MKNVITRIHNCRMCQGDRFEMVHSLAPSPVADSYLKNPKGDPSQQKYPMDLYLCLSCGHVQMLDVIAPEVIYPDYLYVTESSLGLVDHFKRYRDWVLEHYKFAPGSLYVDIGSNSGTLIKFFQDSGFKGLGVEPSEAIAKYATDLGMETLAEYLTADVSQKIVAKYGKAKLVTMNNVMANLDNLKPTMDAATQLLDQDGLLMFETFYFPGSIRNMIFDFQYHEHLNYFTLTPLVKMMKSLGMDIIHAQEINTKGGSIRCVAQRVGGKLPIDKSVGEIMAAEKKMGVNEVSSVYPEYKARIDAQKNPTMAYLRKLKAEGKSIAGFGASATCTTLVYHYGMEDLLDFTVDENPVKIGTYFPGTEMKVLPPTALMERKPDAVVVLAWRYLQPIMAKNQDYLANGGQFIVPLDVFKVIKA